MREYPFICRDGHVEIGFRKEHPNGGERCPLCYLRDRFRDGDPALNEYPFEPDETES